MRCRHCKKNLSQPVLDLGNAPPSNGYVDFQGIERSETYYPLKLYVCTSCWLVQTLDFLSPKEIFKKDYAYFSSFSSYFLEHAKVFVENIIENFELTKNSLIVEVASNDGYLLQFVKKKGIPCYGIEPTESTAKVAKKKGIKTYNCFFDSETAKSLKDKTGPAQFVIANNVLAHVPNINKFVQGFPKLLADDGVVSFEFHYLGNLINGKQFDSVYHEHFSYLSLKSVKTILEFNALSIFDVEEIPTHGGSLRVFAQKKEIGRRKITNRVSSFLEKESDLGFDTIEYYQLFQETVISMKHQISSFFSKNKLNGKKIVGFGAAAKASTLINYVGLSTDHIEYIVDRNPQKQGLYLPGSHIPIVDENKLYEDNPDFIVIFPWNLKKEISKLLYSMKKERTKIVCFIPSFEIIN